jgi:hypothetical protein
MTCINAMDLILKQIDLQFATTTKRWRIFITIVREHWKLNMERSSDIIVFILSDLGRTFDPEKPYVYLVAYVYSWKSLKGRHSFVCLFIAAQAIFSYLAAVTITGGRTANLDQCLALMAFSSEGSFTCHTYCDMGPKFIRSHPKDRHPR